MYRASEKESCLLEIWNWNYGKKCGDGRQYGMTHEFLDM